MKIEGAVVLVIGADSALGAAVVRGLLARGVAKMYADAYLDSCEISLSGTVPLFVDIGKQARAATLVRELTDVTLLVNCLVAGLDGTSSCGGMDQKTHDKHRPTVGRILRLIDAFAPVLSANGGGAVVNALCVQHSDQLLECSFATPSRPLAEWMLADGLRDRLAAQQIQLFYFGAQLAVGKGVQALKDQHALAGHVATRLLHQLDAGDQMDNSDALERTRAE